MGNNKKKKKTWARKIKKKGGTNKRKSEIVFDEAKRKDYLTGFRKRKNERRKKANDEHEIKLKEDIRLAKEKAKSYGSNKSGSNQIVPEVEHILQQSHPTDVHDLGTHTVSVTHLDFSKPQTSKEDESESEEDDDNSGNEKEPVVKTTKEFSKNMMRNISKSISELQTLKQKSKSSVAKVKKASKFQKKTAKSKRERHHHPQKQTKK